MTVESQIEMSGLVADLTRPCGTVVAGLVPLHSADGSSRDHFLLAHLAAVLPPRGIAVLRFDRRSDKDASLAVQARDAAAAVATLRNAVRERALPTILWGVSQGAWAAMLAAGAMADLAGLVLVSASGVSPADQMRFAVDAQLRRAGYDEAARNDLRRLRTAYEAFGRGELPRETAQATIDELAGQPWFGLSWVPRSLPEQPGEFELDFCPVAAFSQVKCPTLLLYGETDQWVPISESIKRLTRVASCRLTVARLRGTGHYPTLDHRLEACAISPNYLAALTTWLAETL